MHMRTHVCVVVDYFVVLLTSFTNKHLVCARYFGSEYNLLDNRSINNGNSSLV